jgi:phosphonate transport system substrate-binding protein
VGSSEYFSFIAKDQNRAKIRLILLSPEIPLGPVLLNKMLPVVLKKQIASILLDLHDKNPKELTAIKDGWSEAKQAEKYIKITPAYYNSFKRQLGKEQDLIKIIRKFVNQSVPYLFITFPDPEMSVTSTGLPK